MIEQNWADLLPHTYYWLGPDGVYELPNKKITPEVRRCIDDALNTDEPRK